MSSKHARLPASGYESPDESHSPSPPPPSRRLPPRQVEPDVENLVRRLPFSAGPSSLDTVVSQAKRVKSHGKVGLRDRICCYQWTWFTMTMATGGVANALFSVPYQSAWLTGIGTAFFLFNIVLFTINCVLITLRFRFHAGSFVNSFTDQLECLFIPSFFVSIAIILVNICEYGVPHCGSWLLGTMEVLFWMYLGCSMLVSACLYLILWSSMVFPLHTMTPVWVFPAYPLLLSAPMASCVINAAIATNRVNSIDAPAMAIAAVAVQGTGFLISFMISAAFLYRLMTQKLPRDSQRPGVFIAIGPSGFTVAGIVNLGNNAALYLPPDFMGTDQSVFILKLMAMFMGLWLWGLSVWFFLVSVGSLWKYRKPSKNIPFQMTWFSFVFPNTALVTATTTMGKTFDSTALKIVSSAFAGCVTLVWILVFTSMLRALWRRRLLWPQDAD